MARPRSLAEFKKSFPDEESCAAFLFKQRWPDGFVCPGCGERRVVGLKSRPRLHECLDCGRQTSVTAGTTMHRSRSATLPDTPAMNDFLLGYESTAWFGFGAPKGTPFEIVDRLNKEINAGLADPI